MYDHYHDYENHVNFRNANVKSLGKIIPAYNESGLQSMLRTVPCVQEGKFMGRVKSELKFRK